VAFSDRPDPPARPSPTRSSPPSAAPLPRSVPSAVKRIILELGLRYRPAAADQLEAHQAKLAALISDLADLSPPVLERAARHWVRQSAFMPKTSDLLALARSFACAERGSPLQPLDVAALRNARMAGEPGARRDLRWVDDARGLRLVARDGAGGRDRGHGA
jgi:hypothetical protein